MSKAAWLITFFLVSSSLFVDPNEPLTLTVVWHQGVLGENLRRISQEYTRQTGVTIQVDLVPWDQWHDTIARDFSSKQGRYDLTIFDSQSMSEFASQNDVIPLNSYLSGSKTLRRTDFDSTALRMYAEFPEGSSRIYALPVNQDTMGLAYRKDLFEDENEKAAFQAKYGYPLSVPETYEQLKDIAAFFTRPEKKLYGIALYGSSEYDAVTSTFNNMLWSFGGQLWDPKNRRVEGIMNAPPAISALEYFKSLFAYAPQGSASWFYTEVNRAMESGTAAMAIDWFYFFAELSSPSKNPFANRTAFASLPGQKDEAGSIRKFHMVGGQGISISRYSRKQAEAWKFLQWFMSEDTQWKWIRAGAQTGRVDILNSPLYMKANSYNASFADSMKRVKDYWHLVEYPQLLKIYQDNIHAVVQGSLAPKDALDRIAAEQQKILSGESLQMKTTE